MGRFQKFSIPSHPMGHNFLKIQVDSLIFTHFSLVYCVSANFQKVSFFIWLDRASITLSIYIISILSFLVPVQKFDQSLSTKQMFCRITFIKKYYVSYLTSDFHSLHYRRRFKIRSLNIFRNI